MKFFTSRSNVVMASRRLMAEPRWRVLYVIDSLARSGAEQSLVSMAPHLLENGIDLEVAYLFERQGLLQDLEGAGVRTHAVTAPRSRTGRLRALRGLIRERRPDLVHTTLFESDVAGRVAARLCGVPSVSSLVNIAYKGLPEEDQGLNRVKVAAARRADMLTAKMAVRFHAISDYVATEMSRTLRVPRDRIEVIPRGRAASQLGLRSTDRSARVRHQLRIGDSQVLLLAAARHEFQKGLDLLLDAMPAILERLPSAVLLVAGRPGLQTPGLKRKICELGLTDRVRLLGVRSDVPDLIAAADLFVLPSRWEGLGSVLLEALALRCPIVASDLPPVRETVSGVAALVDVRDTRLFAAAVSRMAQDKIAAMVAAEAGYRRFRERYAVERIALEMSSFYQRALVR